MLGTLLCPSQAGAQVVAQPFRVQLHVSADETIKTPALAQLTATLQRVRDVELTARDGEYVLSLVIVRTTTGGYAASAAIMALYTAQSLTDIASRLGASPAADGQLVVVPFSSGEVLGVLARNGLTVWGTAITGGSFYRPPPGGGGAFPASYTGDYFFADLGHNWMRTLDAGTANASAFGTAINTPVGTEPISVGAAGLLRSRMRRPARSVAT